jgi:RsaA N-terminal domain
MATLANLTSIYRNVHRVPANAELPADAAAQLHMMAGGIDAARNGMVGDGWSYASAVQWIMDGAKTTTAVAVMTYGFIADLPLTTGGLDYLVSTTGGNPNNLNGAYYAKFDTTNRYINFAMNLAVQGEGRANFIAAYGENASPINTFQKAYVKLFGVEKTLDEIQALLSEPVPDGRGGTYGRFAYFEAIGGDGSFGIGTRAAMVGWLMAEAMKSGQGPYADAVRAYLNEVAVTGKGVPYSNFFSIYGAGGDNAIGGPSDPGLPGESARFAHDWNVDAYNQAPDDNTHVLASDGNDVIRPIITDGPGGLDAGKHIRTAGGNDKVIVDNGVMRGHIDTGSGNDQILVDKFDGRITTGAGYDSVDIGSFAGLHINNGKVTDIAVIDDFQKGRDLLGFAGAVGPGEKKQLFFVATATFDDALTAYASATAANNNTVFEWNGDTYVFHQNGVSGLDSGDGLIKLAGVTGLTVGKMSDAVDIIFAA